MPAYLEVLGLAVALGMDAFTVGIAVGIVLGGPTPRQVFRLAWHLGFFQFAMPLLGYFIAHQAASLVTPIDHWIAFGLLGFIGGKMIYGGLRPGGEEAMAGDPTRGLSLVVLSVATSIDALAAGLSIRVMGLGLWGPCITIGICATAMTATGMCLGRFRWAKIGAKAQIVGGLVLLLIGIRIVVSHLSDHGFLS